MWKNINLQEARTRLRDTVKNVAQEAMETARELRSVHQRQASSDGSNEVCLSFDCYSCIEQQQDEKRRVCLTE